MESKLELGIDEFTLVLTSKTKSNILEWPKTALEIRQHIVDTAKIEDMLGRMGTGTKPPQGYTSCLALLERPYYLAIGWHEDYPNMGVCLKFSAQAWAAYQEAYRKAYQQETNLAILLQSLNDGRFLMHLSRIDLTADYWNYPDDILPHLQLSPDLLYERLNNNTYRVLDKDERARIKTYSAYDKGGIVETFYIGSKRGKTNGFLRCYDKKAEQIQTKGTRYDEALNCESWVRFEAVYKGAYATQISQQLIDSNGTPQELQHLIAYHLWAKYGFYALEKCEDTGTVAYTMTGFTEDLSNLIDNASIDALSCPSSRNNSLRVSIDHLKDNSGLYPTVYKIKQIWGSDGVKLFLAHLRSEYRKKEQVLGSKKDIQNWLNKNRRDLIGTDLTEQFSPTSSEEDSESTDLAEQYDLTPAGED